MKGKILMFAALTALCCGGMNAINKNADQIRIYIDPGHGSWGANDRPMVTVGHPTYTTADPDTCGFYESNTNLRKCFALLEGLHNAGVPFDRTKNQNNPNPARLGAALDLSNNIVMSHVKVGPYPYTVEGEGPYYRELSEIREEVEANNFDLFVSIHSNAASEGSSVNYPLFLYRGYDDNDLNPGSRELCEHVWPYAYGNQHQTWSYYSMTNSNVRGDISFHNGDYAERDVCGTIYKGYYGVLLHGTPGFLVEGYFHTYQPSRHRALNFDVCRHEGNLYARGIIDYMGWKAQTNGDVYGIVRDQHEKFVHALYKPAARTNDVYKPLNGVIVNLMKDGKVVARDTTDNEYNGAFLFRDVQPGEYTVVYSAEGYKAAAEEYTKAFTVKANETTYLTTFLEAEGYVPPAIVYEDYVDELKGVETFKLGDEINFAQVGADANPLETQLQGKTVRRQIVRNGYVYVLALDAQNEPFIYAVNLEDNAVTEISTEGLTLDGNRTLKLSDIAFSADNVLIGCNYGENQFSDNEIESGDTRGVVKFFKWAKDEKTGLPTGAPAEWLSSTNSGNWFNAMTGQTLAVTGTTQEGTVMTTANTMGSTKKMRFVTLEVSNGQLAVAAYNKSTMQALDEIPDLKPEDTAIAVGTQYLLEVSPRDKNQFIIDGNACNPIEFQTAGAAKEVALQGRFATEALPVPSQGSTYFKYSNQDALITPVIENNQLTGLKLFNVTNGLDKAKEVQLSNTNIAGETVKCTTAAAKVFTTINDDNIVIGAELQLYLIRDGKISKFSNKGVEQPLVRGHYAYDLKATVGETSTTFTFKSTGAAENGTIVLRNVKTNEVASTIATGAVTTAENTVTIENTTLPDGEYAWEVQVEGKAIAQATKLYYEAYPSCRGIAIDNNPESANFGTVYVSNTVDGDKARGIWKYDKEMKAINTTAVGTQEFSTGNTASPYRLGMMNDGSVLISDWSDSHAGLFRLTPDNDEIKNMFVGTKDKTGAFTNNGKIIGGGTTCAFSTGVGANTSIYSFVEDYPVGNGGNKLVRYDVGDARTIENEPNMVYEEVSAKLANTNVEIYVDETGIWAAQTRAAPNSTAGVPALLYCDFEGNILYNSGVSNKADMPGNNGSGVALNFDRTKLAVASDNGGLSIYDITRDGITPSVKRCYTIECGTGTLNQIAFDRANNVYLATRKALQVWALPTDKNVGVTPAAGTIVISNEGSVEENVIASETSVYPNPAEDVVYVNATENIETIAIFNVAGAAVEADSSISGNTATINVSGLTSGIYFVKINNGEAVRVLKK